MEEAEGEKLNRVEMTTIVMINYYYRSSSHAPRYLTSIHLWRMWCFILRGDHENF